MREMAQHIQDIAENGIAAGASRIEILVNEAVTEDFLHLDIRDNGCGMSPETVARVTDPFFTTRTARRVGLGLSLFKTAAERCGGTFELTSTPGRGTRVAASFRYMHIDRAPMGDIALTLITLLQGYPAISLFYEHRFADRDFSLDTDELKDPEFPGAPLDPQILALLADRIRDALSKIKTPAGNLKEDQHHAQT